MSVKNVLFLLGVSILLMAFSCHYQGENHLETVKSEANNELVTK